MTGSLAPAQTDLPLDDLRAGAIAIVGMAGRFPDAPDVQTFWANLTAGRECVRSLADDEIDDDFDAATRARSDYVRRRPILDGIENFDAAFFGMTAREAELTDPQQRIFLECAWTAFEDAAIDPATVAGPVGVFAGSSHNTYFLRHVLGGSLSGRAFSNAFQTAHHGEATGALQDFLAARAAYKLDLKGPAVTVQGACATSLVAVAQACQSLQLFQCDMALAGGVSITVPQKRGMIATAGGTLSPDGRARPFDASANGMVYGSGCGAVVLKRLDDAVIAGDHVYAVIRGVGLTNDGAAKAGFTAPSAAGQAAAIRLAHANAGIIPSEIGYVEAHATGTPLGDAIEFSALADGFGAAGERPRCLLGSLKANMGHLDAAAGIAGLIKTALALHNELIPPQINFEKPSPVIDLGAQGFRIATAATPWPRGTQPRLAGVSAFAAGGTNVHVVLEEAPARSIVSAVAPAAAVILPLSAKTPAALQAAASRLARAFEQPNPPTLADAAVTLSTGRRPFRFRLAVAAHDAASAVQALDAAARAAPAADPISAPGVVFMFPGCGAGPPAMAAGLYRTEPAFAAAIDRGAQTITALLGFDIRPHLFAPVAGNDATPDALAAMERAHAAHYLVNHALCELWLTHGIKPAAVIGHGLGEIVAAAVAGVFTFEDGLRLVIARGRAVRAQPAAGMITVQAPLDVVRRMLPESLQVAEINAPSDITVAGPAHALEAFAQHAASAGVDARRLGATRALYTSAMKPAATALVDFCAALPMAEPTIPLISCATGAWMTAAEVTSPAYWARQCSVPVRFADGLQTVLSAKTWVVLEVGCGQTLTAFARSALIAAGVPARRGCAIATLSDVDARVDGSLTFAATVAHLWSLGVAVTWPHISGSRRVPLPGYAFAAKRHWIECAPNVHANIEITEPAATAKDLSPLSPLITPTTDQQSLDQTMTNRSTDVTMQIATILADVAGHDLPEGAASQPFVQLGLAAPRLELVVQRIEHVIGVKVDAARLLGDLSTIDALAAYLVAATDPVDPASDGVLTSVRMAMAGEKPAPVTAALERLFREQLAAMERLMLQQMLTLAKAHSQSDSAVQPLPVPVSPLPTETGAASAATPKVTFQSPRYTAVSTGPAGRPQGPVPVLRPLPDPEQLAPAVADQARAIALEAAALPAPHAPAFDTAAQLAGQQEQLAAPLREHEVRPPSEPESIASEPLTDYHRGPVTPTVTQREMYLVSQTGEQASCAFNVSYSLVFEGEADPTALAHALTEAVRRHDSLRAHFDATGEQMTFAAPGSIVLHILDLSADGAPAVSLQSFVTDEGRTAFDLSAGPLVRATLVTIAPTVHTLVLTAHQSICDGRSMAALVAELMALYAAHKGGAPAPLAPAVPFFQWAHDAAAQGANPEALLYWRDMYRSLPAPLALPSARRRPQPPAWAGATITELFGADLTRGLTAIARQQGTTLFTVLFASVQVLLGRLAASRDVVLTVPMAASPDQDDGRVAGAYVNFLPVRQAFEPAKPFAAHLARVRTALLGAMAHGGTTLGTLADDCAIPRQAGRPPLSDVQFTFDRMGERFDVPGARVSATPNPCAAAYFDLSFHFFETQDGLQLDLDTNTGLYDTTTCAQWIGHLRTLLRGIAVNPELPIEHLPMLDEGQIRWLVDDLNATASNYPRHTLVHQLFEAQVKTQPAALAVCCAGRTMSYAELDEASNQLAHHLATRIPEVSGRIAVAVDRSIDMLIALLAVLKSGRAYVPLDPALPAARLRQTLDAADVAAIITTSSSAPDWAPPALVVISLAHDRHAIDSAPAAARDIARGGLDRRDAAYVIFTSGSTGAPKGVEIGHRAFVNLLTSMAATPGFTARDHMLALTTVCFDIAGLELFLPLVTGGSLTIASAGEVKDAVALTGLIETSGATAVQATPSLWRMLFGVGFKPHPDLKMLCGGEALPPDLAADLTAAGAALFNLYGPTETTIWSSCGRVGTGAISIGEPIANTQMYVLDSAFRLQPPGVPGELWIGGDGLAHGYFGRADLTALAFREIEVVPGRQQRLYRTGDIATRQIDGSLQVLGRADQQVKLRGYRIELEEIEQVLRSSPDVAAAAVTLADHTADAPHLIAFIVGRNAQPLDGKALAALVAQRLPDYMVPSIWRPLDQLPHTANGKLDRKALAILAAQPAAMPPKADPPAARVEFASPSEERIAAVWRDVLDLTSVARDVALLDLGADSQHLFRIAAQLHAQGITIKVQDLLQNPTVQQMALRITLEPALPVAADSGPAANRADGTPSLKDYRWGIMRNRPGQR